MISEEQAIQIVADALSVLLIIGWKHNVILESSVMQVLVRGQ